MPRKKKEDPLLSIKTIDTRTLLLIREWMWRYRDKSERRAAWKKRAKVCAVTEDALEYIKQLDAEVRAIGRVLDRLLSQVPLYELWLSRIKGVGVYTAALLVTYCNPERFSKPGKLFKYCNLHVIHECQKCGWSGEGHKPDICPKCGSPSVVTRAARKGDGGNSRYKSTLLQSAIVMSMKDRFYSMHFEERFKYELSKGVNERLARRRAWRWLAKFFLMHWWLVYRAYYGLPIMLPYPITHMGHRDFVPPPYLEDLPEVKTRILAEAMRVIRV